MLVFVVGYVVVVVVDDDDDDDGGGGGGVGVAVVCRQKVTVLCHFFSSFT